MSKIKFLATWKPEQQEGISKGILAIDPDDIYSKALGKILKKLDSWQNNKKQALIVKNGNALEDEYLRKLEITLEIHYQGRTLDQNALLWALYKIFANEMNGGEKGAREQMITPMSLYEADLLEYGERERITTKRKNLSSICNEYRVIEFVTWNETDYLLNNFLKLLVADDEIITAQVIRGTSKMNTREMGQWIDSVFNRLAWHGIAVTTPGEIEKYWIEHRQHLNDNKIVLLDDKIMTQAEYKEANPTCEGCPEFLGNGTGHLAHIKGFGFGGNRREEPKRNYTSNWLHLCTKCHLEVWHGQGWQTFLKTRPWLRYKVTTAMKRDYKEIGD